MCDHCGCRAFGPIAELSAEHETILSLAWEVAEATRLRLAVDPGTTERLAGVLDLHITKEETGLYPFLRAQGDLSPETSDGLEREHVTVQAALVDGTFDRRAYYALAAHIEQEELELFPLAMFGFDDDLWDDLDAIHREAGYDFGAMVDQPR
jgi:hypothetical protein